MPPPPPPPPPPNIPPSAPPPKPALPPGGNSRLRVTAYDGGLLINGHAPLYIKGVVWRGPESGPKPPNGLSHHPLEWYFDFLIEHGFNAIRLPFNHRDVLDDSFVDMTGATLADPSWTDIRYVGMIKQFAAKAAAKGLLVLPTAQRLNHEPVPAEEGGGLWYSADFSEQEVIQSWRTLANVLCANDWNVFGVDLMDEPVRTRRNEDSSSLLTSLLVSPWLSMQCH